MIMEEKRNISRRDFLRRLGMGAGVAMASTVMGPLRALAQDEKKGATPNRMTYRVQHGSGEQISLLGFGMMRLPNNQEEVNPGNFAYYNEAVNSIIVVFVLIISSIFLNSGAKMVLFS